MMDGMNNGWGMGYGYGWIIGLVVLVVVLALIASAMSRKKSSKQKYNSPHDILKIWYAKGEISKDEYDERKNHISFENNGIN
ncbi:MAG: SHOCT domain-containing protein [Bacteroidota bacterium]|nr:SHOCT domain-containing protein [Bacteroidota bacterium]